MQRSFEALMNATVAAFGACLAGWVLSLDREHLFLLFVGWFFSLNLGDKLHQLRAEIDKLAESQKSRAEPSPE